VILAVGLALLIGLSLGLLGGGGSILTTPVLVYALGVDAKDAIAESLLIVGVTSLVAMLAHARAGNVRWPTALQFGGAGMVGAWTGGMLAGYLSPRVQLTMFGTMMVVASVAMFRGRRGGDAGEGEPAPVSRILLAGVVIGLLLGAVGAGGGFAIVPALVLLARMPMRVAVGTSLAIIAMQSFAGFAGHAAHAHVDVARVAVMSTAAVVGSLVGGRLTNAFPPVALRQGFASFVLLMAGFVLYQQL